MSKSTAPEPKPRKRVLVPTEGPTKNGGARPGAGRKRAAVEAAITTGAGEGLDEGEQKYVDFAKARARNEAAKADLAELEFKVRSGLYLPRDAYRQASAKALATLTQTLRSVPDVLERVHGVAPAVVARVEEAIDDALNEAADAYERAAVEVSEHA